MPQVQSTPRQPSMEFQSPVFLVASSLALWMRPASSTKPRLPSFATLWLNDQMAIDGINRVALILDSLEHWIA